jgi:hypothetical protein
MNAELAGRLDELADWSDWLPLADTVRVAPLRPGVYIARSPTTKTACYVGMAGDRRGRGLRGRLAVYASGKGLASGLGEATFDRALADPDWLRLRLSEAEAGTPARAKAWGRLALEWAAIEVSWSETADAVAARQLERAVLSALAELQLWNRRR